MHSINQVLSQTGAIFVIFSCPVDLSRTLIPVGPIPVSLFLSGFLFAGTKLLQSWVVERLKSEKLRLTWSLSGEANHEMNTKIINAVLFGQYYNKFNNFHFCI